jgi:hypothetical protein
VDERFQDPEIGVGRRGRRKGRWSSGTRRCSAIGGLERSCDGVQTARFVCERVGWVKDEDRSGWRYVLIGRVGGESWMGVLGSDESAIRSHQCWPY